MKTNETFRDRNLKAILTLIPGTPEQMQAEMATLKKSIKKIQMGLGGPTIPVPECPVKITVIHLMGIYGNIWEFMTALSHPRVSKQLKMGRVSDLNVKPNRTNLLLFHC